MHVLSQGNNINSISDGNMLPPDAQDYFKSSIRKRSLITSLCMIPYVAWIPGLFIFVNSGIKLTNSKGEVILLKDLIFELLKDTETMKEIFFGEGIVFTIILSLMIFLFVFNFIGTIVRCTALFIRASCNDFTWRVGSVTDVRRERHGKHSRQYIFVDDECTKPLNNVDFVNLRLGSEAYVVYIKAITRNYVYSFNRDVGNIPENMIAAAASSIQDYNSRH